MTVATIVAADGGRTLKIDSKLPAGELLMALRAVTDTVLLAVIRAELAPQEPSRIVQPTLRGIE